METTNEVCSVNKSTKCSCKCGRFGAVVLIILIAGIVCWHIHRPKPAKQEFEPYPGTICTVQFRRDVLGAARDLPIGPTVANTNGAIVTLRGELIAVNREAILLDQVNDQYIENDVPRMKRFWIPKSSILTIEYEPARSFLDLPRENLLRIQYEARKNYNAMENQ